MYLALKIYHGIRLHANCTNIVMKVKRKNIMHLIASNFFGGPEKQIVEHLKILDSEKYSGAFGTFLEGDRSDVIDRAVSEGIRTCVVPMAGVLDFTAQIKLNSIIRDNAIDLLCVHGYKASVMGWIAARVNGIPVIVFSRGYTSENLKVKIYEWLEQRILSMADGIVSVSHGQKDKLYRLGITGKRNWVVHNAVNIALDVDGSSVSGNERNEVFVDFGVPVDAMLVVTAGRLSPEKGHRYLVEALAKNNLNKEKIFVLFCGEGSCMDNLKKQAKNLGVEKKCLFVGFRHDLQKIFRAMDLFVLPSLTEGLPNVVLEAFSCAKPVIVTPVGGVPELVKDGVNGVFVPPKNPKLLAQAMEHLLRTPKMREEMGLSGFYTVKKKFGFVAQARKLEKIYSEVLEEE